MRRAIKVNASAVSSCHVAFAEGLFSRPPPRVVSAGSEAPDCRPVAASHGALEAVSAESTETINRDPWTFYNLPFFTSVVNE